jgi:hypothetical protein
MNYGTHADNYTSLPYFTSAASIGQDRKEIDVYIIRLREAFEHFLSQDPFKILKKNAQLSVMIEEAKNE